MPWTRRYRVKRDDCANDDAGSGYESRRCWFRVREEQDLCIMLHARERSHYREPSECHNQSLTFHSLDPTTGSSAVEVSHELGTVALPFQTSDTAGEAVSDPARNSAPVMQPTELVRWAVHALM